MNLPFGDYRILGPPMKTLQTWIKIWKLSRQCQYIKSLRDFMEYTGQPMETPVREEWLWWRMTLKR
jgi:hypothetical protein